MAFSPRSGLNGTVTLNGVEIPVIGWDRNPSAQLIAFINSKSGGHPVLLPGITSGGMFTIDYDWDDSNNPFGGSLNIRVGSQLTNVKLLIDGSAGTRYVGCASAYVQGTPIRVEVPAPSKIIGRILAMVDGTWNEIGGSAS